jgi:alkylhydroperoxidase family enzyme
MTYIKAVDPSEAQGTLKEIYKEVQEKAGTVPTFFRVLGLRPDILEGVCTLGNRLMDEEHGLSPVTKALIASYVSKVNACAY